jgi:acetyl esterase/lipase
VLFGFVVSVIRYRAGWSQSTTDICIGDSTQVVEALYRAMQDCRAALRFLVANADQYFIDPNNIFLAGGSAGGMVALGAAYYTQSTADARMPGMSEKLGSLDADNSLTSTYAIRGMVSMWGSLMTDPSLINNFNAEPTIFFHGMLDTIIPYDVGHFYLCANYPLMYGTKPLYERLSSLGVPTVAQIDPNDGHGVFDFTFREDNITCFLRSIMNNHVESGYYEGWQSSCR